MLFSRSIVDAPNLNTDEPPMDKLVDASWLASLLRGAAGTEEARSGRYVVLEVFFPGIDSLVDLDTPAPHDLRCIPGAVSVHPSYFESGLDSARYYPNYGCPDDGNLLGDRELHDAVSKLGIGADVMVVVYGKGSIAAMSSCRVVWALTYAGVKDVRLLDGGFEAWLRHQGSLQAQPSEPVSIERFNDTGQCVAEHLATTEEVAAAAAATPGAGTLVDIRRLTEYDGSAPGNYRFFQASGHIPSAVHQGNWDELVHAATDTLKEPQEVRARWEALGLCPARGGGPLIFYCGTGWRSSIGWFLALRLGWPAKNYDDGFYGWIAQGRDVVPPQEFPAVAMTPDADA